MIIYANVSQENVHKYPIITTVYDIFNNEFPLITVADDKDIDWTPVYPWNNDDEAWEYIKKQIANNNIYRTAQYGQGHILLYNKDGLPIQLFIAFYSSVRDIYNPFTYEKAGEVNFRNKEVIFYNDGEDGGEIIHPEPPEPPTTTGIPQNIGARTHNELDDVFLWDDGQTNYGAYMNVKFGPGYFVEYDCIMEEFSGDQGNIVGWTDQDGNGIFPIELSLYNNGYYLDWHNAASDSPVCDGGDGDRKFFGEHNFPANQRIIIRVGEYYVAVYDYLTGELLFSQGNIEETGQYYEGDYRIYMRPTRYDGRERAPIHLHSFTVYDKNGTVKNKLVFDLWNEFEEFGDGTNNVWMFDDDVTLPISRFINNELIKNYGSGGGEQPGGGDEPGEGEDSEQKYIRVNAELAHQMNKDLRNLISAQNGNMKIYPRDWDDQQGPIWELSYWNYGITDIKKYVNVNEPYLKLITESGRELFIKYTGTDYSVITDNNDNVLATARKEDDWDLYHFYFDVPENQMPNVYSDATVLDEKIVEIYTTRYTDFNDISVLTRESNGEDRNVDIQVRISIQDYVILRNQPLFAATGDTAWGNDNFVMAGRWNENGEFTQLDDRFKIVFFTDNKYGMTTDDFETNLPIEVIEGSYNEDFRDGAYNRF